MNENLKTEARGDTRIITMSRPEAKNALNGPMGDGLLQALKEYSEDETVRCVILTGAEGYFCVGGDVKGMNAGRNDGKTPEEIAQDLVRRMEVSVLLHEMPKPTIAAIEGAAAGAGLSLALACDFRICSETAKITTAFAKVGLSGDFGGAYFIGQMLGSAKLRELYMMSPLLSGREAGDLGLMTKVVAPGTALDEAIAFSEQRLANGPTKALGRMKENFLVAERGGSLRDHLEAEAKNLGLSMKTADHKEAAKAFVEKREPKFEGT